VIVAAAGTGQRQAPRCSRRSSRCLYQRHKVQSTTVRLRSTRSPDWMLAVKCTLQCARTTALSNLTRTTHQRPHTPTSPANARQDDNRQPTLLARHLPRKRVHAPHRSLPLPRGQFRRPCSGREAQGHDGQGEGMMDQFRSALYHTRIAARLH
jgi:hypothetical protein